MNKPKLKSKVTTKANKTKKSKESLGNSILESAQHIWLAGLGALSKTQAEGNKLFESLVKEGTVLEQKAHQFTHGKVDKMRGAVESSVSQAKVRTQETWGFLEKILEDRVASTLINLSVPSRKELQILIDRVEELSKEIKKTHAKVTPATTAKPTATKSARKTRDDLADLAKDLEEAQLATKK